MAELSKIRKNGVDYDIKDATARQAIKELQDGSGSSQNGNGLTATEKSLMLTLFKNALYPGNMADTVTALETLWSSENTGGGESGSPETPEATTYTISDNLTNVTNSNSAKSINRGESYKATLSADNGYILGAVIVLMGGVDVTSAVYADGVVDIESVTGNISITASAIETSYPTAWQDGVAYTYEIIPNSYVSSDDGSFVPDEGSYSRTDLLPCYGVDVLYAKAGNLDRPYNAFYDADKNFIQSFSIGGTYPKYVRVPDEACYFAMSCPDLSAVVMIPSKYPEQTWEDGVPYELTFIADEYVNDNQFTTYKDWKRTDYLNCVNASKLVLSEPCTYGAFYNAQKEFVRVARGTEFEVTFECCYFATSNTNAVMDTLVITPHA